MKRVLKSRTGAFAAVILGACLFVVSCEHDKPKGASDNELGAINNTPRDNPELKPSLNQLVNIAPAAATVSRIGQAIEFNALSGEYPMTWRVSNTSAGTLTVVGFSQAVYTALSLASNEVIVTDGIGHQGVARVNGLTFAVLPSTVAMGTTQVLVLTTEGGTAPFTWTLSNTSLGALAPAGSTATFTAGATAGVVTITVTDAAGQRATATVTTS